MGQVRKAGNPWRELRHVRKFRLGALGSRHCLLYSGELRTAPHVTRRLAAAKAVETERTPVIDQGTSRSIRHRRFALGLGQTYTANPKPACSVQRRQLGPHRWVSSPCEQERLKAWLVRLPSGRDLPV